MAAYKVGSYLWGHTLPNRNGVLEDILGHIGHSHPRVQPSSDVGDIFFASLVNLRYFQEAITDPRQLPVCLFRWEVNDHYDPDGG